MGSLSDLKGTMTEAHQALQHLDSFTRSFARQGRGPRMPGGLGSSSGGWNQPYPGVIPTNTYVNPDTGVVTPVTTPYTDPSSGVVFDMTNPANLEAMNATPGAMDTALASAASTVSNGVNSVANGLQNVGAGVVSSLKSVAVIGVVGLIAYMLLTSNHRSYSR